MTMSLTAMPGHLLRRCQQIAMAIFLEECAAHELTPLQFAVLQTLASGGAQDQVTLGGATAMDRSSTALVVRRLEQRGLLRRARSRQDQRAKIVRISALGKKLLAAVLPAVEAAQTRIVAPLDAAETKQLMTLLQKLAEGNNAASRAPEKNCQRVARQ